jgi:NADH:ubiquinone oxidoreductase subunit 2 (subunit N)
VISAYVDLARLHAPLLLLTAPLLGAALAFALPWRWGAWVAAVGAAFAAAALALDLGARAISSEAPLALAREGVALSFDGVAIIAAPLLAALLALMTLAAGALVKDFAPRAGGLPLALALCVGAGWTGALMARDFIGVFVAAEAAWLAGVALLALSPHRGALNGALRMLTSGGAGAALFLIGLGFIHRGTGGIELATLSVAEVRAPGLTAIGMGLVLLSLAAKVGVAPLHYWSAAAFGRAGRLQVLMLGVIGATGALAALLRVAAHAVTMPEIGAGVSAGLAALGAASVVIGSVQAVGASNLARLGAYAVAAQAGVLLLTLGLGSPAALAAALVQLTAFAAASVALFGGGAIGGVQALAQLDGLGRRAPLAGAALMAGALSLMGAPLTLGFLGRWRLIEAGVGAGWWWASGAVILASLAGVFYGGRLIERLYFRRAAVAFAGEGDGWRILFAPALVAAIAAIGWGLAPAWLLRACDEAALLLMGGGP